MGYKPAKRNFEKVKFEELRKVIDPKINEIHDELSLAYYDYWKHGKSKPFYGFDVQATPEESKKLFDKLHGLIWEWYDVIFHNENKKQPANKQYSEDDYRYFRDQDKLAIAKDKILELRNEGIDIKDLLDSKDLDTNFP